MSKYVFKKQRKIEKHIEPIEQTKKLPIINDKKQNIKGNLRKLTFYASNR
jgi:hypothetical protein